DFVTIHEPVAGIETINQRAQHLVEVMRGATTGLLRFAWGVAFDDRLDHFPKDERAEFDPAQPRAFLRVERQTIWGLPGVGAALFTIRPYIMDIAALRE